MTKPIGFRTFAQQEGLRSFNWHRFLHRKRYSLRDLEAAEERAAAWVTCACGNMCANIPRHLFTAFPNHQGQPKDEKLADLGCRFARDIGSAQFAFETSRPFMKHIEKARKTLERIEARSAIVLRKTHRTNVRKNRERDAQIAREGMAA